MRHFLLAITILLSLVTLNSSCTITELKSNLYFSENPITFDPPLIQKNNTIYLPIRSLIKYFDGKISQSRKDYVYSININNNIFLIKENNFKYKFNSIKKQFRQKPFKYKTRLYLPLNTVLNNLNYTITKNNNQFYALAKSQDTPPKENKSITNFNYKKIEDINSINELYLPISKQTIPITTHIQRRLLYGNITKFLEYLGYSITIIENKILLKKKETIYSFTNGSSQVVISDNNKLFKRKLGHIPKIINKQFFVEIQPFLNDLGFDLLKQKNQLIVLKKLHSISLVNNEVSLEANSNLVLPKGTSLSNPNRIYWDLKYTKCPSSAVIFNSKQVTKAYFGQKHTSCRMVLYLNGQNIAKTKKVNNTNTIISFIPVSKRKIAKKTSIPKRASSRSLKGKVIIIDPGHGGNDPGAVTKNNDFEKYYTLDISRKIQSELKRRGAKAVLIRNNDSNPSLYQRVRKINKLNGDFLVSVHVNSFINNKANGTETYYYKASEKLAAKKIQNQMVTHLKLRNNGIKHARMYVLKHSKIPGVLIEPCFMTNSKEYSLLKKEHFRQKIAQATVDGIGDYFKSI